MLQMVLGIAGTGKTYELMRRMEARAIAKRHSILLVPEQFSSTAEGMIYCQLGDENSAFVEVASFRTMAERILKMSGGINIPVLSDAARAVFVRRALDVLGEDVRSFSRHRREASFCAMCADTISELKTAGATSDMLRAAAVESGDGKWTELALIYDAYEAAIKNTAMDPEDRLELAAQRADCGYFTDKACFIDNFDGFTAPEYALLQQVMVTCEEIYVALCCDGLQETDGGLGMFSPVRRTAAWLQQMATRQNIPCKVPVVLEVPQRCKAKGPSAINELLAYNIMPEDTDSEGVTSTEYEDEWVEVRAAAAEMHRLALLGVPYSRMALVCRDISMYESSVRRAFGLYNIPLFVDAPATIEYTAPVAFIRAALRLLRDGLSSEPLLALLKSGLLSYTEGEIASLENYVYTWNPKPAEWKQPFEKNPAGLLANMTPVLEQQLAEAEKLREMLAPLAEAFLRAARGKTVVEVSRQLYLLLDKVGAPEHVGAVAQRLAQGGEAAMAEESGRAWDMAMQLLDQMVALAGEEKLSPAEYDDLFLLLVRATDFGRVPQSLECAVFTSADRMRLADPDYCFVVGLCEGVFPMQVGYSGLLNHNDRDLLAKHGALMPGSFENRTLLEDMFFYRALTSTRKGLYLSWPKRMAGVPQSISSSLARVCEVVQPAALQLSLETTAATPLAAFEQLGAVYRDNTSEAATLYAALEKTNNEWLPLLTGADDMAEFRVRHTEAVRRILGKEMTLSATKAERYYECRFSYYMERVLGAKPRRKAEISPMESGTFVHYILEQVLSEAGEQFAQMDNVALAGRAAYWADMFIEQNLPDDSRRAAAMLTRVKESTAELLCYMRDAAANSYFCVDALELALADGEDGVPPLVVETDEGHRVRVTGKIDRVDVLRTDTNTYLSIIDYKTGTKKFNLADVYCGLNMQMMIYMHTLCVNGQNRYPNAVPAGVLYLGSDPAPATGARDEVDGPAYKMDGLLLQDADILRAMDRQAQGVFIPVRYNKDGSPRKSGQLASLEKMGNIAKHVEKMLGEMADGVYAGQFGARPLVKANSRPCDYCPYRAACRHEDGHHEAQIEAPPRVFEQVEEENERA